jgi:hypothetical protein
MGLTQTLLVINPPEACTPRFEDLLRGRPLPPHFLRAKSKPLPANLAQPDTAPQANDPIFPYAD